MEKIDYGKMTKAAGNKSDLQPYKIRCRDDFRHKGPLIFVLGPVEQQVWEVNIDVANNLDSGVHLASASAESQQPWQDG